MMYSLDEMGIIPAVTSTINHRSEINPYIDGKLPIFVAPMTCILSGDNFGVFNKSRAIPIMPRNTGISDWVKYPSDIWYAVSLDNFKEWYCNKETYQEYEGDGSQHILIDIANGHMQCIYDYVKEAKSIWGKQLTVMVGNIANPETYLECCKAGVDYVRVGIGGGSACSTGVQTGIHASMVWLLTEIQKFKTGERWVIENTDSTRFDYWLKENHYTETKIIADGGINTIDKAIKCLALGANYVMMGKLFAQTKEACGKTTTMNYGPNSGQILRQYYGMASEQGQKDISGGVKKNPEGIETWVPIKYTLNEFLDKFEAALKSCMSYCDARTLNEFIGKCHLEPMTEPEFKSYYK